MNKKQKEEFIEWLSKKPSLSNTTISVAKRIIKQIDITSQEKAKESIESKKLTRSTKTRYKSYARRYFADFKQEPLIEYFFVYKRKKRDLTKKEKEFIDKDTYKKIEESISRLFKYNIADEMKKLISLIYGKGETLNMIKKHSDCCDVSAVTITNRLKKIKKATGIDVTIRKLRRGYYINLLTDKYNMDIREMKKDYHYNILYNNGVIAYFNNRKKD
jgi:hypothetical protein